MMDADPFSVQKRFGSFRDRFKMQEHLPSGRRIRNGKGFAVLQLFDP